VIPFRALLAAELRKTVSTRAARVLLTAALALTVAAEAVPPWRQSKVRLGRPIKLSAGVKHQEMKTTSEPVARTIPRFMHQGARRA